MKRVTEKIETASHLQSWTTLQFTQEKVPLTYFDSLLKTRKIQRIRRDTSTTYLSPIEASGSQLPTCWIKEAFIINLLYSQSSEQLLLRAAPGNGY